MSSNPTPQSAPAPAHAPAPSPQRTAHALSLSHPTSFWRSEAAHLSWALAPTSILQTDAGASHRWTWCGDGQISASWNLLGRHVAAGYGDAAALLWESPVTGRGRRVSYTELLEEVVILAGVLAELGVGKGDRVLVYMPMIPEAVVAMLAATHLGAVHSVVFGGFAPKECAKRIEAARPTVVLTASCGIEGGTNGSRKILPYLPLIREAVALSAYQPRYTVLLERPEFFQTVEKARGELQWGQLVRSFRVRHGKRGVPNHASESSTSSTPDPAAIEYGAVLPGSSPHYLIYTSGTTSTPKGVIRAVGGHLLGLSYSMRHMFDLGRGDVILTASDVGWVVGHSYSVYGPLLVGAASIIYEGKPINTPDAGQLWRLVARHRINVLFTAPSALRAVAREDPHATHWRGRDLTSLRGLFLAGERSEPAIVERFQNLLDRYAAPGARVIDNYWSSESGSPITGLFLRSHPGAPTPSDPARPGACGLPAPGFAVAVVDDAGEPVPPGTMGNIVLAPPLAPTALTGLHDDSDDGRFWTAYFARFGGRWFDTGDAGMCDEHGYLTVLARTDDVLNIAAHRLSTASIEGAAADAAGVAEAYVVPRADPWKGHVPVAFVVLLPDVEMKDVEPAVREAVRKQVGAIASLRAIIEVAAAAVPRTRSGKVMRRAFRALVAGEDVPCPENVEEPAWRIFQQSVAEVVARLDQEDRRAAESAGKPKL